MGNHYSMELLAALSAAGVEPSAISRSSKWVYWASLDDGRRCRECEDLQGKIYEKGKRYIPSPPEHFRCRCDIVSMLCIAAGYATRDLGNGADWWLKKEGRLPEYYMTYTDFRALGWRESKAPARYAPSKMMTKGVYGNYNGHLPDAENREWYEADINYYRGRRNSQRILWSNDGLMFVTYDHYKTFVEIH